MSAAYLCVRSAGITLGRDVSYFAAAVVRSAGQWSAAPVSLDDAADVEDVVDRLPALGERGAYLKQEMRDKVIEHKLYIRENGVDMPEVAGWTWGGAKK